MSITTQIETHPPMNQVARPTDNFGRVNSQLLPHNGGEPVRGQYHLHAANWISQLGITSDAEREDLKQVGMVDFPFNIMRFQKLSVGVGREKDIVLLSVLLAAGFLIVSPFLALLALPPIFYGLYTHHADKKKLVAVEQALRVF